MTDRPRFLVLARKQRPGKIHLSVRPAVLGMLVILPIGMGYLLGQNGFNGGAPAPVPTVVEQVPEAAPMLPVIGEGLPSMDSETFRQRIKAMGLDPKEVEMFKQMAERETFSARR